MKYKAKFVKRLKGGYNYITKKKDNDILVYEYRGNEYNIEDIPPYKQEAWYFPNAHRWEQEQIDKAIENTEKNKNKLQDEKPINLDEIWEMLGWNE